MKNQSKHLLTALFIVACLFFADGGSIFAQNASDSSYLPPIKITSANGYGPYYINTKRTNVFIVYELPANTSKITMRFIDSKGEQLGDAYIKEGSNLDDAVWDVESEDVGFALSPNLSVEVQYSTDSLAVYRIAYLVYPDTIKLFATAGWGPFYTNRYPLADTSWHPVPELYNTFTVSNLPPRTDSLVFQILATDSTVIDTLWVFAPQGEYLDSAAYENIRMDSLPLSTRYFRTLIWCEGGPNDGLSVHNDLTIIPQKPKLVSKSEGITLIDSIGTFVEHQFTGQALQIDSIKYAEISNGPGHWDEAYGSLKTIYPGPYSFDIIQRDYSIEAWLKFDADIISSIQGEMTIMSVDSVWRLWLNSWYGDLRFVLSCQATDEFHGELFTAILNFDQLQGSEWHHIALTCDNINHTPSDMNFYFDGEKQANIVFNEYNYDYIRQYVDYSILWKTQPLYLGHCHRMSNTYSAITAMDEIRLWEGELSEKMVWDNFHKKVLQVVWLVGYWNFDDLRNRLGFISDLSYNNNRGHLKNGAAFIPQYPFIQTTLDTILYYSSNALSDSVNYAFIDHNAHIVYTDTDIMHSAGDTLLFDVSELPDNISKLRVSEFAPGYPDSGYVQDYNLEGLAPMPIATPQFNWNTFYYSADSLGRLYNSITVSGLPDGTSKVKLGLKKGSEYYDVDQFTQNSIPYRYSLTLNGNDNYIETSQKINAPENFTMSLWFKTTTNKGGRIIGFSDSRYANGEGNHDRELIMEKDGSLRFYLRTADTTYILSAVHNLNDGVWHNVAVTIDDEAWLYVDGSLVDYSSDAHGEFYQGYWVIGRNDETRALNGEFISEYFGGSLCEIIITDAAKDYSWVNANRYGLLGEKETTYHYKCDDGKGTVVHDYSGNNDGTLKGSSQTWFVAGALSYVVWHHNMINKLPGTYTFFATVYYAGGPVEGATYQLGRNILKDPLPGHFFAYNMRFGFGYFNEGTKLINWFDFFIDYTNNDSSDWKNDFVKYQFFAPDHFLIHHNIYTYTDGDIEGEMSIDMGDAPPGSYLSVEMGYHTTDDFEHVMDQFSFPIYINPMLPPIVSGDFGPFDQAIAPGSMAQPNTFIITTEILSDLNKVTAKFHDKYGKELGETPAVQIDDTTWHITYEMGKLSPPTSNLSIEYYLGADPRPALVQGPFPITIHKTRPKWFDFIDDDDFHDITEAGDSVTFNITTYFSSSFIINNASSFTISKWVPLLGGSNCTMETPNGNVYLAYYISEHNLNLGSPPKFFQKVFNLGGGNSSNLSGEFHYSQDNTYNLDDANVLTASQNFHMGGSLTSGFQKFDNLAKKVKKLINIAEETDPESLIISPSFNINYTGAFQYSSRLNLKMDSTSGDWGSIGNLDIDANPDHTNAYKNSASYQFYEISAGPTFQIGAKFLDGLVEGDFATSFRFDFGWGHSYVSIPRYKKQALSSFKFEVYGKFIIQLLWGWYTRTIWGPKMFYSTNITMEDLSNCFFPIVKNEQPVKNIAANSSWPELTDEIIPVSKFSQMPMPYPQPRIVSSEDHQLFTWIERGKAYGERGLEARYLNRQPRTFSDKLTIELNNNALNNQVMDAVNKNLSFFSWAQTRYDNKSILKVKTDDILAEFVKAQDIWYAVYDMENDSVLLKGSIEDDRETMTSGRAEANPVVTVISDSRAIVTWQVADLDLHESELWYLLLEKVGNDWTAGSPYLLAEVDGIISELQIGSPSQDKAIIAWLNTSRTDGIQNTIMTATFDGTDWSIPEILLDEENFYYNYLVLGFNNGLGGLVISTFIEDTASGHHEKLLLLPWDAVNNQWYPDTPIELMVDSVNHLQHPQMAISEDGLTTIAFKAEKFIDKDEFDRISQVDLLIGDLNNPSASWIHIEANEFVCDTTKQVADLQITYIGTDTLMILSNEYPMLATNCNFEPVNGRFFGDPYMNLVLRCFAVNESGEVQDVDEGNYFLGINEYPQNKPKAKLYQNYPNPCSDFTTITFDIPGDSRVKLELFDIKGNRMASLLEQRLTTGRYEIKLNTSLLETGTYIYKLTTDDSVSSLRMIVKN